MTPLRSFWHLFKFQFLRIPWHAWAVFMSVFLGSQFLFATSDKELPKIMSYIAVFLPVIFPIIWEKHSYSVRNSDIFLWSSPVCRHHIFTVKCLLTFIFLISGILRDSVVWHLQQTSNQHFLASELRCHASFIIALAFGLCWLGAKKMSWGWYFLGIFAFPAFFYTWNAQTAFFTAYEPWIWTGILIFGFFVLRNAKKRYLSAL